MSTRRLTPDVLPLTWTAALFGLLVGATMLYVPFEFTSDLFRYVFPIIRPLGAAFLAGGTLLLAPVLQPSLPRIVEHTGRALFLVALFVYWWTVNVLPGGITGAVLYPMMMLGVFAEVFRSRSSLPWFHAGVGLAFGVLMLATPHVFPVAYFGYLRPLMPFAGILFLVGGALSIYERFRRSDRLARLATMAFIPSFSMVGYALGRAGSWTGMELYIALTGTCVLAAIAPPVRESAPLRLRLFRAMALATVPPLLAAAAVASYIAQRAIDAEVRDGLSLAVTSEAASLREVTAAARRVRDALVSLDVLSASDLRDEAHEVHDVLGALVATSSVIDAIGIRDPSGRIVVSAGGRMADLFEHPAPGVGGVSVSHPYAAPDGSAAVSFLSPLSDVPGHTVQVRIAVGRIDHPALRSAVPPDRLRVYDVRDGTILSDTVTAQVLGRMTLPDDLQGAVQAAPSGVVEAFEDRRRSIVAWRDVPGAPWRVIAVRDLRAAFAPVTRLSATIAGLLLLAAALALSLAGLAARNVTLGLERVRDAAESFAAGSLDRRAEGGDTVEIASLAASFNRMAERISHDTEALEEANRRLSAAVQAREEFLSIASHELRTPLTPLLTAAELMQRESGAERVARLADIVRRQVARLTHLVNDLLDTSRMRTGKFSIEPETSDLGAFVRDCVERIRQAAFPDRPVEVEAPDAGLIAAYDPTRIEQVLSNLLENADRYSPKEAAITVRVEDTGEAAEIRVIDRGIGVPRDLQEKLFEPFFRAPNAATRHGGGLGLGLFITREIVARHGGSIRVESAGDGAGSTFVVRLPRLAVDEQRRLA